MKEPPGPEGESVKITLIYDNTVYRKGLVADWGFSCLVEAETSPKILFDTGARGEILLSNMEKLGIDPSRIDMVVISHGHFDHIGGLAAFLRVNRRAAVYVPASVGPVPGEKRIIAVGGPRKLHENIFSTGELAGIEQSLAIREEEGTLLITGCSHPGVAAILDAASRFGEVRAVVGGLHGFNDFRLLEDLDMICPTHCTVHGEEIKAFFPDAYTEGGAGRVLTFSVSRGASPLRRSR